MPLLIMFRDGHSIPFRLKDFPATIGRGPGCDVQLDTNMVSRFHARLTRLDDTISVQDLDSGSGTYVNGEQLCGAERRALRSGDLIKIGPIQLSFENDGKLTG